MIRPLQVFQDQLDAFGTYQRREKSEGRLFWTETNRHFIMSHLSTLPMVRITWWRPHVLEILFNDQSMVDVINDQKESCLQLRDRKLPISV